MSAEAAARPPSKPSKRLGLLVPPFHGHLLPMSALARALAARGHEPVILTLPDGAKRLADASLRVQTYGAQRFPPGSFAEQEKALGFQSGVRGARSAVKLVTKQALAILEELPHLARELELDGLVMDQAGLGAEAVAAKLGLPLAVACCALPLHREANIPPWTTLAGPARGHADRWRNRFDNALHLARGWRTFLSVSRARWRLGVRAMRTRDLDEIPPSRVQVTQLPAFLDFPRHALPEHFRYTAPWHAPDRDADDQSDFDWKRRDERPLVYASLGTLQNRLEWIYETIAEACRELPVQLLVSLGRRGASLPRLPGDPWVVDFAPQLEVLARTTLCVSHAGLNTALETLRAGVPMIAVPISHEQPGIAARMVHAGVGRSIALDQLDAPRLRNALSAALEDSEMRERSIQRSSELRAIDGPDLAARWIGHALFERDAPLREEDSLPTS